MVNNFKLDPWGQQQIAEDDYIRLIKEFGIEEIDDATRLKMIGNRFIRRKIIFGHRDLQHIFKAIELDQPWAVMSGIKPSGPFHLGTLTTALEIVLDRNKYNNSQLCSVCNEFEPRGFFQHFHLYTDEKRECFITLHSGCVFKEETYEKLNELLDNFDYITYFD